MFPNNISDNSNLRLYSVTLISFVLDIVETWMRESDWVTFSKMVCMSSSFELLALASRDLSQAEKIHKLTTIFTQNDNLGHKLLGPA